MSLQVGDVSVSEGSLTLIQKIEDVTGKFRYDCFGYLCMVYLYVTVFK